MVQKEINGKMSQGVLVGIIFGLVGIAMVSGIMVVLSKVVLPQFQFRIQLLT